MSENTPQETQNSPQEPSEGFGEPLDISEVVQEANEHLTGPLEEPMKPLGPQSEAEAPTTVQWVPTGPQSTQVGLDLLSSIAGAGISLPIQNTQVDNLREQLEYQIRKSLSEICQRGESPSFLVAFMAAPGPDGSVNLAIALTIFINGPIIGEPIGTTAMITGVRFTSEQIDDIVRGVVEALREARSQALQMPS